MRASFGFVFARSRRMPDRRSRRGRCAIALGCSVAVLLAAAAPAAVVVCPAETFPSTDLWRAAAADAAPDRLQALLDDQATALMRTDDGGLISVRQATLTASLPLAGAYDAKFGPAAADALARCRSRPDRTPADLDAVATRYPLARAAADARAAAARRSLDQGDPDAAHALLGQPPASSAFGPVPFDAPWYAKLNLFGGPRDVPVGSAAEVFVADRERGVLALAADGRPLWRYAAPPAAALASAFHPGDTGRGPLSVPAVLADDAGRPQLVVVRLGTGLTALRASDGRQFWTTDGDPAWAGLAVLSAPAVSGRCVAVVATATVPGDDPQEPPTGTLQVIGADVMDGRPMWRCPLGPVFDPLRPGGGRREAEPFRDGVPPTFAGDLVVVPDNAGAVVAVGRFAGDVRWARPYPPAATDGLTARRLNTGINRGLGQLPPLPTAALLRWSAAAVVAGDVVFVAPQDTATAMGLDRRTGRVLWQTTALPEDATCVGVAGGRFILAGANVSAVDPATGAIAWSAAPPADTFLTGPPAVRGDAIVARTTEGLMAVSPVDGSFRPAAAGTADFHAVAATDVGRAALVTAGLASRFGD